LNIEDNLKELEKAIQNDDYLNIKKLNEEVSKSMMEIGQKVYSQGNPSPTETPGQTGSNTTIDTDFSG
jgi:hypothetical protein